MCVVRGSSPKPKVECQDSAGNIRPAEEPQVSEGGDCDDIIHQTTVTETGRPSLCSHTGGHRTSD